MDSETLKCMAHNCDGNLEKIAATCCSEIYQCRKCKRRMKMDRNSAWGELTIMD